MATKSISQLDTQATANETDLFEVAIVDANSASGYASKKESAAAIADAIVGEYQYPLRITGTTAKTIAGAINELKNLVDLLPQFAIEVVQTLPVSDISTTTIYLVPASDPEQGNYYEEYIYVNNAWELVGTTAVDLSGYYTSAQVDTLLAAKADSASLATVATSGAYSDLSGKPTIDTALDSASTNAVENRAVASEINSIKSDITVDGSASGDIATFVDGSDNPLKALTISIVAQQSGSGDPSPTNVRPITGWTGANATRTRKNLADLPDVTISYESYIYNGSPIDLKPGTYTFSVKYSGNNAGAQSSFRVDDKDGNQIFTSNITIANGVNKKTFTITDTAKAVKWYSQASGTYTDVMIELGSQDTAYEPYNGTTYPISWQNEAGTVYGGTLDVKTGVLTVTHERTDLGTYEWTKWTSGNDALYYNTISGKVNNRSNRIMCTALKAVDDNATGLDNANVILTSDNSIIASINTSQPRLMARCNSVSTAEDFKTAMSGVYVVYELATPITYQLTPTEIRSLLGLNNVWADCGSITELKYTRDLNLCINDIISRIEALEGGSNTRSLSVSSVLTKSLTSELDTAESKTEETEKETKEEAQNER